MPKQVDNQKKVTKKDVKNVKKDTKAPKKEVKKVNDMKVIVTEVTLGNSFRYIKKGDEKKSSHSAIISGILTPMFNRKENKEEKYTFSGTSIISSPSFAAYE